GQDRPRRPARTGLRAFDQRRTGADRRAGAEAMLAATRRPMEVADPHDLPARVPFRTVLLSIVGLWLCYFLLTTIRSELLEMGFTQEMLWRRALATACGIMITVALWLVLRLFDARPLWTKIAAALLLSAPVAMIAAQAN